MLPKDFARLIQQNLPLALAILFCSAHAAAQEDASSSPDAKEIPNEETEASPNALLPAPTDEPEAVTTTAPAPVQEPATAPAPAPASAPEPATEPKPEPKAEPAGINVDVGIATLYDFRGWNTFQERSQQDQNALFAPSLTWSIFNTGLSLGYWGAYQLTGEPEGDGGYRPGP